MSVVKYRIKNRTAEAERPWMGIRLTDYESSTTGLYSFKLASNLTDLL